MGRPLIFLIAGEPSGDLLGGRLMAALRRRTGDTVDFAGIGGERMAEQGLASRFPMAELSLMGLVEVLPHVPRLLRRIDETVEEIRRRRPDAVVTIDAPGFAFRVGKRLAGQGIPLIHYVAPSVWAWKPGRARRIARFLDHLLALLPFEPPYFEREGLPCTFVGHPVIESGADRGDGAAFRARHGIADDAPLLCVLPGSRFGEVARLAPVFGETVRRLAERYTGLRIVVPTVTGVADVVAAAVGTWAVPTTVVRDVRDKYDAFAASTAALAASGTVALELAMAGTPAIVAYRLNPVTAVLARLLVKARFANLVNIVLDHEAVPEYLLDRCRPDLLAPAVARLIDAPEERARQREALREALLKLGLHGPSPSERAAEVVLDVIARHPTLTSRTP